MRFTEYNGGAEWRLFLQREILDLDGAATGVVGVACYLASTAGGVGSFDNIFFAILVVEVRRLTRGGGKNKETRMSGGNVL